jgi:NitT/TauT family transport system substrate-binding protein
MSVLAGEAATSVGHRHQRDRSLCVLVLLVWLAGTALSCGPTPAKSSTDAPATGSATGPRAQAAAPAAPTAAPALLPLKFNYSARGSSHSVTWFAYEGGYFREQGLDVELTYIPATSLILQTMIAGDIQLSTYDPAAAIQAALNGADSVFLATAFGRLIHSVIAQPSIQQPEQLRGKSLGVTRLGSSTHSAARVALREWGLVPDQDVAFRQLNEIPAIFAALEARQLDAGMLGLPSGSAARQAGYHELLNLTKQGPEYPSVVVGALRDWVAANPEAVQRFARAYVQGLQRGRTDRAWAVSVYPAYLNIDDPKILDEVYAEFLLCCEPVPYVSEAGLGRLMADLAADEPRLAGRSPSEFIESRPLREVETSGFLRQLTGEAR